MTSRVLETPEDLESYIRLLHAKKLPLTVSVVDGRKRSVEQNKLQRMWVNEIAEQLGEYTPEYYRGYCKAWFGIPILRQELDGFEESYTRVLGGLSYEQKIEAMQEPLDFPITRLMTMKQKKAYLDAIYTHFTAQGCKLTEPNHD